MVNAAAANARALCCPSCGSRNIEQCDNSRPGDSVCNECGVVLEAPLEEEEEEEEEDKNKLTINYNRGSFQITSVKVPFQSLVHAVALKTLDGLQFDPKGIFNRRPAKEFPTHYFNNINELIRSLACSRKSSLLQIYE